MYTSRLWARSAQFMIALMLCVTCLTPATSFAATTESIAKVLSFTSTNAQANGAASINGSGTATIISGSSPTQQGSVFTRNPVALAGNANFSLYSELEFRGAAYDNSGDTYYRYSGGTAFVLQGSDPSALGKLNDGYGYDGIANSIAIVIDETNNVIKLLRKGDVLITTPEWVNKSMFSNSSGIANYTYHLWVDYDGTTLEVRVSSNNQRPSIADLSYPTDPMDITSLLGTLSPYAGFTASTGFSTGVTVNKMYLDNKYNPLHPDTITYQAAPTVASATVPANGSYTVGQSLNFTIGFSEPVTVDTTMGTPSLGLDIGGVTRQANYVSGSGSSVLTFSYPVQSGDSDTDGIGVGSISLGGGTVQSSDGIDANLSLVGVPSTAGILVIPQYTLQYDGNGNTGGSVTSTIYPYQSGSTVTVLDNDGELTKDGYTFAGWNDRADGTGTDYAPSSVFTMGAANLILYAKWKESINISSDASLASLSLSGAALNPVFQPSITSYSANVGSSINSVVVTATASDPGSTIVVNGQVLASGSHSDPISLRTGSNTIIIIVTAADGMTTQTYTIEVNRASEPGTPPTPSTPSPSTSTPSNVSLPTSNDQNIQAVVESGSGDVLLSLTYTRTIDASGKKKDKVILTPQQAEQMIARLAGKNVSELKLILLDEKDEVFEWTLTFYKDAAAILAKAGISLEIVTSKGSVHLSKETLSSLNTDLTLRITPMRSDSDHSQVTQLVENEPTVRSLIGHASIAVFGMPVLIETNVANLGAEITLPIDDSNIGETGTKNMAIFIKHGDGSVELLRGQVVKYDKSGKLGIRFKVEQFSTFAIVRSEALNIISHDAYITGYNDGTFRPNEAVTRAEMATMLSRAFDNHNANASTVVSFSDVSAAYWAKDAIASVSVNGWMIGQADGGFQPKKKITRAEMATIAARFIEQPTEGGASFSDTSGHWAEVAIAKVQAAHVMTGYTDGTFHPEAALTRAEAVAILNKLLGRGLMSGTTGKWNDVSEDYWAYRAIQSASNSYDEDVLATN